MDFKALACFGLALVGGVLATRWVSPAADQDTASARRTEVEEILSHMSMVSLDDGKGNKVETIRISGVNVQIVNGMGKTNSGNGLGNLIVGYDETGNSRGDERAGSHNVVIGTKNSFPSAGCLIAGESNVARGTFSTVAGGASNDTLGSWSCVVSGDHNEASASWSCVLGGRGNRATGSSSTVLAGDNNVASGTTSTVIGGEENVATNTSQIAPPK
ncbi:MAG: hypothetical protein HYR85_16880 [Planctomycetes bacterium]|nr:hypothetical protein [Planctomycetota bacterium]MBI3847184.1 hypothetical protein [Planctomycetota bacterium]